MNISSESKERIIETLMWVILAMFLIGLLYRNLVFYPETEYEKVMLYNNQLEAVLKKQNVFRKNIVASQLNEMKNLQVESRKSFFNYFSEKKSSLYYITEINKLIKNSKLDIEIRGINSQSEKVNIEDCELYGLKYTFNCSGDYLELKKFISNFYKTFNPVTLQEITVNSKGKGYINAVFSFKLFYFIREKIQ